MHGFTDWHAGWFLGMHLIWWTFWLAVGAALIWALIRSPGRLTKQGRATPLQVLQRRYAEGAITTAEYEERKAALTASGAASLKGGLQ